MGGNTLLITHRKIIQLTIHSTRSTKTLLEPLPLRHSQKISRARKFFDMFFPISATYVWKSFQCISWILEEEKSFRN